MQQGRPRGGGFTLIELIVVIVLAGVLLATVTARLNFRSHDAVAVAESLQALVRYAQKVAVAQQKDVYVVIAGNSARACYDAACAVALQRPGSNEALAEASPGISLSAATLRFDALGRPVGLAAQLEITIQGGDVTRKLFVEPETGHVHT